MERNSEIEIKIKEHFKCKQIIRKENIRDFLNDNIDVYNYLKTVLLEFPEFINVNNIIICICNDIYEPKICDHCGNRIKFDKIARYKNKVFCSVKCKSIAMSSSEKWKTINKETIKKSFTERYNVENPFQLEFVKEKIKQTLIKKYGVDSPLKSTEIKEKVQKTCEIKYRN